MQKMVLLAVGLCLAGTGCGTTPRRPAKAGSPPRNWEAASAPVTTLPVITNEPPAAPPAPPPLPAPALTFTREGWVPLEQWTAAHGFERVRRLATAPVESFAAVTPAGVLRFSAGSTVAVWDGLEVRLGFAPRMHDGKVLFHSLDLRKNLEPLLRSRAPLRTAGRVIVLDPGHGGPSPGTRSAADGQHEKAFTLDWAMRTATLLRQNGWQVFLTRTNDVDVPLTNRVAFAEQLHADLFVSLHFNSAGGNGGDQAGLETYCLTPQGMTSTLTRDYPDDPGECLPNNAFDDENFRLALRLHRALLRVNGLADRGVRRARFLTVLRGQNRPAALIEGGYLSNPAEARRIAQPEYRQQLAEAVAAALGTAAN